MSDEPGGMPGSGPEASGLSAISGRLTEAGELIIALGAVLVVGVDLLGNIILEEYSFTRVAWVVALVIIFAVAAQRWSERPLFRSYGRALTVLALAAGATVARELVADVRSDYLDGGMRTLMALIFYVGGALLLVGAWQQWSMGDND